MKSLVVEFGCSDVDVGIALKSSVECGRYSKAKSTIANEELVWYWIENEAGQETYAVKSSPLPVSLTVSLNDCSSRLIPPAKKHIPRQSKSVANIEPKIAAWMTVY
jgi:hypothetical protein